MVSDLPPDLQLQRLANAYQLSRAVQVAARLGLGRLLDQGPRTARDLARSTGTDEGVLTRLLRFLAGLQVVEELPDDTFGPTPLSARLHRVDNVAQGEEAWAAWNALPEALRTGRSPFSQVHGQPFYDYAASHPEQLANWRESNAVYAAALAPAVVGALDLAGTETVVDVGGGQGTLLASILQQHPECRGVLFDLPEAVDGAAEALAAAGVDARCEVVPGDAFAGVPEGGDVYLLCRMLFNWEDDPAVRLLARCREAMAPGQRRGQGRLLVVEALMPEPGEPGRSALAGADLHHFLLWGAGYRTRAELAALFVRAGLELVDVRPTADGGWQVVEGRVDAAPLTSDGGASATPLEWRDTLERAFAAADDFSLADVQPTRGEESSPFLAVVRPLLAAGYRRLQTVLSQLPPDVPLARDSVGRTLFSHVAGRLSMFLRRTLVLELQIAVLEETLAGDTPQERFQDFIRRLGERETALEILGRYPVLARQVVECVEQWLDFAGEFLARFVRDWPELLPLVDGGELTAAEPGAGDSHRDGRSVILLTFSSGRRLVYKPRSMAGERAWNGFLGWANARGFAPAFRTLEVLDRGGYGWVEFVEPAGCTNVEEVQRFYERQGGYLALLYLLGANDVHFENLIAAGEHPLLIDLETLFHPPVDVCEERLPFLLPGNDLYRSVQHVGLLPHRIWGAEGREEGVDVSGLTSTGGQMTAQRLLDVEGPGTDRMRFTRRALEIPEMDHAPRLAGERITALDHAAAITAGFARLYRLLVAHRQEALASDGPLAAFKGAEMRVIFRPTFFYTGLLGEGFHPDVLQDARERDRLFDGLWAETPIRPRLRALIPAERRDLERADIPIFTTRPESCDLWTSRGERLPDYWPESALCRAEAKLAAFGEADLARQLWLIETALDAVPRPGDRARRETYPFREADAPARPAELLAAAKAAGERLEALAFRGPAGDVSWSIVTPVGAGHWSYGVAEPGLYQGLAGIALFLAYLGEVAAEPRFTDLARGAWTTLRHQLRSGLVALPGVGAFTGWGGILYGMVHLATLWDDASLFAEAEAIVEGLPEKIAQDDWHDVVGGAAGCLLSLLALYRVRPSARTLKAAVQCGERLLANAREVDAGVGWVIEAAGPKPLAGLSHGAAGIALALLELAALTKEERYRELARRAVAYERSLFAPAEQNWIDLREGERPENTLRGSGHDFVVGWCHGAPGIGLARLAGLPHLDDAAVRDEIAVALATTRKQGFGSNHSLCHGDLGNLDLLLVASQTLGDPGLREQTYRLAGGTLAGIREHGWLYGYPAQVEPLGLMVGLAGIGYQLLRLAAPDRVPSVLVLEPPPTA